MKAHVTDFDGMQHLIDFPEGWPLMEAMKSAGIGVKAECGGCCLCGTCHVYVDDAWVARLPTIGDDEHVQLGEAPEVTQQSRLSCQIVGTPQLNGIKVALAPVY
jgi:2Fe-2S ferredoxin